MCNEQGPKSRPTSPIHTGIPHQGALLNAMPKAASKQKQARHAQTHRISLPTSEWQTSAIFLPGAGKNRTNERSACHPLTRKHLSPKAGTAWLHPMSTCHGMGMAQSCELCEALLQNSQQLQGLTLLLHQLERRASLPWRASSHLVSVKHV